MELVKSSGFKKNYLKNLLKVLRSQQHSLVIKTYTVITNA